MASSRKPATFSGNSPLAPLMAQFIQEKRACGYRYNPGVCSLRRLDAHLCRQGLQQVELTKAVTSSWLAKQPHETDKTQRARVNQVRHLALFLRRLGLPADVPDHAVGAKESRTFMARVLTHEEVRRLLEAADRIEPMASTHLRHIVLPELLRVLYGCGLRLEEALSLRMRDVDLVQGVLRINDTKFRKDRLVPPARPLVVRLQKYAAALGPRADDDYFFPSGNCTAAASTATSGICCTDAASAMVGEEQGLAFMICATPLRCTPCCGGTARAPTFRPGCRCWPPTWATPRSTARRTTCR